MRLFNRDIKLTDALVKSAGLAKACFRTFSLFKSPSLIFKGYLKGHMPPSKTLEMRNGIKVHLSDHPHDVITVFVVFGKRDYGTIENGSIVVDIGANIGTFALYAISNGAAKVYSIEPNSESYATLLKNIENNGLHGKVVPFKAAVSDSDGAEVLIPKQSSPYNSISYEADKADTAKMEKVHTLSLRALFEREKLTKIDLLKIDCEGAEFKIIPSLSTDLMKSIREIKVEYLGNDPKIIIDHLRKNGFNITKHEREDRFLSGMIWASQSV